MAKSRTLFTIAGISILLAVTGCSNTGQKSADSFSPSNTQSIQTPQQTATTPAPNASSTPKGTSQAAAPNSLKSEEVTEKALAAVTNLARTDVDITYWNNQYGDPQNDDYMGSYRLSIDYSGDDPVSYLVNGHHPTKADPGPVLKQDMRFLVENASFNSQNDAGSYLGQLQPGTGIPLLANNLLASCAQDGTWRITGGAIIYNPNSNSIESIDYSIESTDLTVQSNKDGELAGPENYQCRTKWDFTVDD